jgi:GNAT superfamily N-acetyltransferase
MQREESSVAGLTSRGSEAEDDPMLFTSPSILPPSRNPMYPYAAPGGAAEQAPSLPNQVQTPVHTPKDPEALYSPDHKRERQERQARREELKAVRATVDKIPVSHLWEVPGNANVVFAMRDYRSEDIMEGRRNARDELPFLFKAFEQGQAPPPRPGTKKADLPRAATIHEYLDWTVTASVPQDPDELDFEGFRVLVLYPRFKLWHPPPSEPYNSELELKHPEFGAPKPPIPHLQVCNKPICAATIRIGPSWVEVPFYATQESRRNKGNGRALLMAVEDICRYLGIPRILLCSTDDPKVKNLWSHLGFSFTSKEHLESFGVTRHDLLHMDNTVQMHKDVSPEKPKFSSMVLRHRAFKHRLYYVPGGGRAPPISEEIVSGAYWANKRAKGFGAVPKKVPRKR